MIATKATNHLYQSAFIVPSRPTSGTSGDGIGGIFGDVVGMSVPERRRRHVARHQREMHLVGKPKLEPDALRPAQAEIMHPHIRREPLRPDIAKPRVRPRHTEIL